MARTFNMRAWHTVLTNMVYWTNTGDVPDFAGAESGYTPGDLTAITVVNYVTIESVGDAENWLFTRLETADILAQTAPGATGLSQSHFSDPAIIEYPSRINTFTSRTAPGETGLPLSTFSEPSIEEYPDRRTPDP